MVGVVQLMLMAVFTSSPRWAGLGGGGVEAVPVESVWGQRRAWCSAAATRHGLPLVARMGAWIVVVKRL